MTEYTKVLEWDASKTYMLRSHGVLSLAGTASDEIEIYSDLRLFKTTDYENETQLVFVEDAWLEFPKNAKIQIDRVKGDARIQNFDKPLSIRKVLGCVVINDVSQLDIKKVYGDCLLQNISGKIKIDQLKGDLIAEKLSGPIEIAQSKGNIFIKDVEGPASIKAEGDITLILAPGSTGAVDIICSSDVELAMPKSCSVKFYINSLGGTKIKYGSIDEMYTEKEKELSFGSGEREIRIKTTGTVNLLDEMEYSQLIDNSLFQIDQKWNAKKEISSTQWEEKARKKYVELNVLETATNIAEEAIKNVMETIGMTAEIVETSVKNAEISIQQAVDRVQEQMEDLGIGIMIDEKIILGFNENEVQDTVRPGVSEEEQYLVMSMLEKKQITVEEAERLLDALDEHAS